MNNSSTRAVKPVSPAAGYIGGKRNLAGRIVPVIDRTQHLTYAEPFVGMGGIFLRRTRQPQAEVINDISGDVANFFRILQRHYRAFMDELKWRPGSRAEFQRLIKVDPATLTDLERAARFLYLQRMTFGGKVAGRTFGVSPTQGARFNVLKLAEQLAEIHERLANVVIEQLPYTDFIRRYDRPGTLFYLDPPYWGCETDYGPDVFSRDDFDQLAEQLASIEGKFLLSINDTPETRACFERFAARGVETTYSIAGNQNAKRAGELLVSNFPIGD
ncbi:MAG: DNA adenine methylase [Novosphingobium sp.]|nr:DNA adenine methylase [Novosphingobium sp.]